MEDLTEVSKALNESLGTSVDDGSSFQHVFEGLIASDDPRIRQATIEALHETLTTGSDEQKNLVLEHAGLTFIPLLISQYRSSFAGVISELATIISSNSSAKEVLLSLVESLGRLEYEAQSLDEDGSDDLDDDIGIVPEDLVGCVVLVLSCLASAIPRLKTNRSTPTLLSISDPLIDAFTVIVPYTNSSSAPRLLEALCEMVQVTWTWVQTTTDSNGEQKAILTNFLFMGITLLSSRLDARLVERLFVHLQPRYGQLHPLPEDEWVTAQQSLQNASAVTAALGVNTQDLIHRLTHPSSISPYSSLAALTLLVSPMPGIYSAQLSEDASAASASLQYDSSTAVAGGSRDSSTFDVAATLLEDSMPVLSAALSADALDAGLAWTWHLVQNGAQVSYDTATLLLELLVPPAVGSPSPTTRMAIIKLIARVIDTVIGPAEQARLFLQLAESENPFEGVRVQSITMLREAISKPSSALLSHIDTLAPTLFTLPTSTISPTLSSFAPSTANSGTDVPPLQLPPEAILSSMWISWFIETVNLLRVVLSVDKEDKSGLRSAPRLKTIYADWVRPQQAKVEEIRREASHTSGESGAEHSTESKNDAVDFVLDRWDDALNRLCEEIRAILGDEMDQVNGPGLKTIAE